MDAHTYGTVLPCSQEKGPQNDAKYKQVCENAVGWAYYESCSLQVIGSSLEPRKGLNLVSKTPTGGQGKERGLLYCWRPT